MRVLDAEQMREADRRTIEEVGIPSLVLMENAGREVLRALDSTFGQLETLRVAVLCGKGNNGGDGFVVSRLLLGRNVDVRTFLIGRASDVRPDAAVMLQALRQLGADIVEITDATSWELHAPDLLRHDLIVDALFGTGLAGPVTGLAETVIADLNASDRPVIAVDLPSGLQADTADVPGAAVDATVTVALGAPKLPLVLPPAEALVGRLVIADIGIPDVVIDDLAPPHVELLTSQGLRPAIRPRAVDAHKGDFGRVLIVAGSPGRTGAAALAALAALRSGAGLVTVAVPRSSAAIVASLGAEYMTLPVAESDDGTLAPEAIHAILDVDADVIAAGPGLGRTAGVVAAVHALVATSRVPLILDADAVVAFAGALDRLSPPDGPGMVITPHPGEMSRLVGVSVDEIALRRPAIASDLATSRQLHVVLKGYRTLVASPDGRLGINMTGNPGMATAGAGDVLTGMIAAWCAQLDDLELGTRLAVFLHGRAGDLAAAKLGETAMIAGDIIGCLGDATLDLTGRAGASDARR